MERWNKRTININENSARPTTPLVIASHAAMQTNAKLEDFPPEGVFSCSPNGELRVEFCFHIAASSRMRLCHLVMNTHGWRQAPAVDIKAVDTATNATGDNVSLSGFHSAAADCGLHPGRP